MIKKSLAAALSAAMVMGMLAGCANSTDTTTTTTAAAVEGLTGDGSDATIASADVSATTTAAEGETTVAETYPLEYADKMTIDYTKYVDVSAWDDVTLTADDVAVSDYDMKYAVAYALNSMGIDATEITDRAAEAGDTVTIDFTGYIDDEELENGSGTDQELMIGSGSYIDGFEEGLVGANTGDSVTLNLQFPDPYPNNTDLSGKDVRFEVTVKSISGYENITDEQIAEASADSSTEYATYDEFYNDCVETTSEDYKNNVIWQAVIDNCKELAVNEDLVNEYISTYLYYYSTMASYYGMDLTTLLSYYGMSSVDDFKEQLQDTAEQYAFQACVALGIADEVGITVTEDDIIDEYNTVLNDTYSGDEDAMEAAGYTKDGYMYDELLQQVEDYVYSHIEVQ